ncbi:MAG: HAD hydrolase-like protein [Actinobacteria bacterium]|nr:HAD hydrolase-like protein [Actinomycetota bacterium]
MRHDLGDSPGNGLAAHLPSLPQTPDRDRGLAAGAWQDDRVQRLVLFDLDGTLTDAAPGIVSSLLYALDEMGIEHPDDATIATFLGPPLKDTFGGYFGMDEAGIDAAIAHYRVRYNDVGLFENEVYPGIPDLLARLTGAGFTLATSTSKPTVSATRILEHFSLAQHFTFIGGASLDSERNSKAEVIAHTLDELNALGTDTSAGSITMVGDRQHDVLGAAQFGIPAIGVLWGYGSRAELEGAGAVATADDVGHLGRLLS